MIRPRGDQAVDELAEHLGVCRAAASMCPQCSGQTTKFGRVTAVRQLRPIIPPNARGPAHHRQAARLMLGIDPVWCQGICVGRAVREVHHPLMGSLPLCEPCALIQERRNLR